MASPKIPNTSLYPKGTSFGAHTPFVTAAYPKVRLIPQDLCASSLGFCV